MPTGIMLKKFCQIAQLQAELYTTNPYKPKPGWYFFYGTLKDPKFLAQVAELDEEPQIKEAKITNACIKYFGSYPVLCPGLQTVNGLVWHVPSVEIVHRLRDYESNMYREQPLNVELLEDGKKIVARAFIWNSYREDLQDEPLVSE